MIKKFNILDANKTIRLFVLVTRRSNRQAANPTIIFQPILQTRRFMLVAGADVDQANPSSRVTPLKQAKWSLRGLENVNEVSIWSSRVINQKKAVRILEEAGATEDYDSAHQSTIFEKYIAQQQTSEFSDTASA